VDSGKVVLRHVMVGILTPTSAGKAAALLAAKDPAAALTAYERGHVEQNGKSIATGRARPLGDAGLKPLEDIPADIESKLTANQRLMASLGLQATPAMVWRDATGNVQMRTGAPPSELPAILGPR
jgi:thiol:disulfide interchange protein DsbG